MKFKASEESNAYNNLHLSFKNTNKTYEIGTKLDAVQFIKSTNATDIDYPKITSDEIGEHTYIFVTYDHKGYHREFVLTLTFVDSIKPVLNLTTETAEITEGDEINLKDFVKECYDPVDGNLKVNISRAKDWKKIGTHEIEYSAKDKHGNVVRTVLTLVVKQKVEVNKVPENEDKGISNGSNGTLDSAITPQQPEVNTSVLPEKKFLFSDGYTMPGGSNPSWDACLIYKGSHSGACYPITDPNNPQIFIGSQYIH